ncbi:OmpA family protein [Flavobacterium sp. 7A]|uniref:OmpA family protein n=1 Tax=Flavobacterium sp. 7A TaxID=2940571 RepID=UPI0022277DF5|nr:OmpA family protein [Flavobacterium sp. 7A]MCW2119687.1 outer membrane protein OmpA-like peptidoglycan-associated protein [Flavobacterium sp. 7A]
MKTLNHFKLIALLLVSMLFQVGSAQTAKSVVKNTALKNENYFQISPRGGFDTPFYSNNTPYIDYNSGLDIGLSVDYYWKWFGIGADVDYISNSPESTYPTQGLLNSRNILLTSFDLSENGIKRFFYGIGPDFKHQSSNGKWVYELNTRAGLSSIKGGRTELRETTTAPVPLGQLLNFHAGYNATNVVTAKAQVRVNYFFNNYFGVHAGAYYMRHFDVEEMTDPSLGITSSYQPFISTVGSNGQNVTTLDPKNGPVTRLKTSKSDISSIGVFAGISLKLTSNKTEKVCASCPIYSLAVTARDKYTKEILPQADVVVKNLKGDVVQSGTTNTYGVVVFNNVTPDNYTIDGKLYDIKMESNSTVSNEFKPKITLQKEILYTDLNFILKGKVVLCNSPKPLSDVSVNLKNLVIAEQKNTLTNDKGEFIFNVAKNSTYEVYGKKDSYFSQTETILTKDYDRNTTLFVKLEVCMEEADCGKAIGLKNILYDLDKYFIKEGAKKELNRLVRFMQDNPLINVEISSHTDSRASQEYNATLSQNRANAAVDYVVSQGIARNRIKGIGYGETQLLNNCGDGVDCSESQHQLNRRTEMKVICPN